MHYLTPKSDAWVAGKFCAALLMSTTVGQFVGATVLVLLLLAADAETEA